MKQERIVKIFTGRHIDLDSIISISDVQVGNTYCPNDLYFEFEINCRLMDKPIVYTRYAKGNEKKHQKIEGVNIYCHVMKGGQFLTIYYNNQIPQLHLTEDKYKETLAAYNLQTQIDELVLMWKNYINQNTHHPLPPGF